MAVPSKQLIFALIAVILIFVVIVICLPEREPKDSAVNLVVSVDTDVFIGSIGIGCTRWDGSSVSGGVVNADGSPIVQGDRLKFSAEGWPTVVSVYADPQGSVLLASCVIETAPPEGCIWQASVLKGDGAAEILLSAIESQLHSR